MAVFCFGVIGIIHHMVMKSEECFSGKCRPVFFMAGVTFLLISICVKSIMASIMLGILACVCLWSIYILYEREKASLKENEQTGIKVRKAKAEEE